MSELDTLIKELETIRRLGGVLRAGTIRIQIDTHGDSCGTVIRDVLPCWDSLRIANSVES